MTPSKTENRELIELTVRMEAIAAQVEKLQESNDGTMRTRGLKEKITIAEMNIEANKQAYQEVINELKRTEQRLGSSLAQVQLNIEMNIQDKFKRLEKESEEQETILKKIQPWINALSWFIILAGGIIVQMILTGKLHLVTP